MQERDLDHCRNQIRLKNRRIADLRDANQELTDERNRLEEQNVAACDAKSIIEIGLIHGEPWIKILQTCHDKLKEVTPDLIEEDPNDEEDVLIIEMKKINLVDKGCQTDLSISGKILSLTLND